MSRCGGTRILLRQHGKLDFPRHAEVFLHDKIFGAQFLAAAGEFGVRAADSFLGKFLGCDVPKNSLQPDDFPVRRVEGVLTT